MSGLPSPMNPPAIGTTSKWPLNACCAGFRLDRGGGRRDGLLRLVRGDARREAAEDLHVRRVVARDAQRVLLVRDPERGGGREGIALRHHADDLRGLAVHAHRAADHRRVRVETLGPELVGQNDDRRRALDRVAREDGAPELGRDAGYVENVAVGEGAVVALRLAVAGEVGGADIDAAEGLELSPAASRTF